MTIKVNDVDGFKSLDEAMEFAKNTGEFAVISGEGFEIVGKFGVDSVKDGKCPNGEEYNWKKRRI